MNASLAARPVGVGNVGLSCKHHVMTPALTIGQVRMLALIKRFGVTWHQWKDAQGDGAQATLNTPPPHFQKLHLGTMRALRSKGMISIDETTDPHASRWDPWWFVTVTPAGRQALDDRANGQAIGRAVTEVERAIVMTHPSVVRAINESRRAVDQS